MFLNLVWDGHVALLLGNSGHWSDVAHLGGGLTLDDGEVRLRFDNLDKKKFRKKFKKSLKKFAKD